MLTGHPLSNKRPFRRKKYPTFSDGRCQHNSVVHGNRPYAFWISGCSTSYFLFLPLTTLRIESQQVVSVLLTRGRLSLPQIHRYTQLKPRIARASILVLVQHNLLWHAQSDDGVEAFEFNVDECLARLRFGKVVFMAQQLFGKVVSLIQRSFVTFIE